MTSSEPNIEIKLAILNNMPMPVWACDRECIIVYWNKAAERLYGWAHEEAIGHDFVELFVNAPEREKARIDCCDIIDNCRSIRNMADDIDKFGITRNLITQCFPIYDIDGHAGLQVEISYEVGDVDKLQRELHSLQIAYEREIEKERMLREELLVSTRQRAMSSLREIAGREREVIAGREKAVIEVRIRNDVQEANSLQLDLKNKQAREQVHLWEKEFQRKIYNAKDIESLENLIKEIENRNGLDI